MTSNFQDWHPPNHISFYEHAKDSDRVLSAQDQKRHLKAFDVVQFESPHTEQVKHMTLYLKGRHKIQKRHHIETKIASIFRSSTPRTA